MGKDEASILLVWVRVLALGCFDRLPVTSCVIQNFSQGGNLEVSAEKRHGLNLCVPSQRGRGLIPTDRLDGILHLRLIKRRGYCFAVERDTPLRQITRMVRFFTPE